MKQNVGHIEVVCGSMFSGKTEELIRRVRRAMIAKQKVQVVKPEIDQRYHVHRVTSHNGLHVDAVPMATAVAILDTIDPDTTVVAIDEIQFFDHDIIHVCQQLADQGKRVICAGLDMDFRGETFGFMPELLARAEVVDKLQAICVVCGEAASRTQRLINGIPAAYDDPIVMIGAEEVYEARCRHCHAVPPARSHHAQPAEPERSTVGSVSSLATALGTPPQSSNGNGYHSESMGWEEQTDA